MRVGIPLLVAALLGVPGLAQEPAIENFEFEVTTLDGQRLTHEDFGDRVLLIDYWGTWCGPCRRAIPTLQTLYAKYRDRGLSILGLAYEQTDDPNQALTRVRAFAAEHGIEYPLALGTDELRARVPGFRGYPTLLFFRRGMRFDHLEVGWNEGRAEALERWIERALEERAPKPQPVVVDRTFTATDGRKLRIGGGTRFVLLVLVHPRSRVDMRAFERLGKAVAGRRLEIVEVSRADRAVPGTLALRARDLGLLRAGKAFPAFVLVAPDGSTVFRDAGKGIESRIAERVAKALQRVQTKTPR